MVSKVPCRVGSQNTNQGCLQLRLLFLISVKGCRAFAVIQLISFKIFVYVKRIPVLIYMSKYNDTSNGDRES